MSRKILNIHTDASFNLQNKTGAYAFFIDYNTFRAQISGSFKQPVNNSLECELKCIINALSFSCSQKSLNDFEQVLLHTDCETAIGIINRQKNDLGRIAFSKWSELLNKSTSLNNRILHIKSHTNVPETITNYHNPFIINKWCDFEAKRLMRKNKTK